MLSRAWRQGIDKLLADRRSAPEELVTEAIGLLLDTIGDSIPTDVATYRPWLMRLGRELIGAKPSVARLFRLVNGMLWATEGAATGEEMRQRALHYLQEYQAQNEARLTAVARIASKLLSAYPALMTFSRSTTVLRTLLLMAEQGEAKPVYLSEGRPNLEGQTLASELAWAGIHVTLGVDMALFGWLPLVRALVIGGESLSVHGLVAKLGTAPLAKAAHELDIPVYVLCTTEKFMPAEYHAGRELGSGPSEEIMPESTRFLTISNVYHDITPLEWITSVITEHGPLQGEMLRETLEQVHIFPGLRGR